MKHARFRLLSVLCVFVSALLCGCSADSIDTEKELNYCISSPPITIDPQIVSDVGSLEVISYFISTLYEYDAERNLIPALAESSDVSEDGLTVTYHLRDGLKWSNGKPLTAEDFVFGFQRLVDPETKSGSVYMATDCCSILNAQAVAVGEMPVHMLGVSAPDRLTFVVQLENPCSYLNALFTMPGFVPCNRDFFNTCGTNYATTPETILSCGPYTLDRYEPLASQIHMTKNPDYYRAEVVSLPGVNIQVVQDSQQEIMCYESGMLDIMPISGETAELAQGDPEMTSFSGAIVSMLHFNFQTNPNLQNKNIRMAISKSYDRKAIAENVLRFGYIPITRLIPNSFYMEEDGTDFAENPSEYDEYTLYEPEQARTLWQQGLKELGLSGMTLDFCYLSIAASLAEAIAQQMEKTLPGLTVKLTPVPSKEWLRRLDAGEDYDLIYNNWTADYADPTAFLGLYSNQHGTNDYRSAEYDALYNQIQSTADKAERDRLMHEAETMLMKDAVLAPLFNSEMIYLIRGNVTGFQTAPTGVGIVVPEIKKGVG